MNREKKSPLTEALTLSNPVRSNKKKEEVDDAEAREMKRREGRQERRKRSAPDSGPPPFAAYCSLSLDRRPLRRTLFS
jgi:hypothetical protein